MRKILFVNAHFSTGGSPAYILKLAESLKGEFEIHICEVSYYGAYEVQRKIAQKLYNFHSLQGKQEGLIPLIEQINPNIIHLHEVPESFLNRETLNKFYNKDRKYNIVVTSHSSLTRRKDFTYIPDRLIAVNRWQKELFEKEFPDTQVDMWEYPIEDLKNKIDRYSLEMLAWPSVCSGGKHILNVGLWTPGKNQGELLEIARHHPQNIYHFVGNQAENFRAYWEPLMKNKPNNCKVWGEREDLPYFYRHCDEMYFCSKLELNPLCIKEALSYGLPVTMRRLETYGTDYDNEPLITFI